MRKLISLLALAALVAPGAAMARSHHHHPPKCATGHVLHRHHSHYGRCVKMTHSTAVLHYAAKVDPAFTQAATDPLAVTYAYSADVTQTTGSLSTNLASTGQLPAGILDFYSAQVPGGPEALYCSMNVGGAVTGGTCPITYSQTGTYAVTTEYIPNSATAVTQTDQETVSPFTTTTTLTVTPESCAALAGPWGQPVAETWSSVACYSISAAATDQNGNAPPSAPITLALGGSSVSAGIITPGATCDLAVYYSPPSLYAGVAGGYSPDCLSTSDIGWQVLSHDSSTLPTSWSLTATYPGVGGWAPSAPSAAVTLTP